MPHAQARRLIRLAEMTAWNPVLREALRREVELRGFRVSPYADCGELADTLELALRTS